MRRSASLLLCCTFSQGVFASSPRVEFVGSPSNAWAMFKKVNVGRGNSTTYEPQPSDYAGASFVGYVSDEQFPGFSFADGPDEDTIRVFRTFVTADPATTVAIFLSGDDGKSLYVNGDRIAGGGFSFNFNGTMTLTTGVNLVEIAVYNGPGGSALEFRQQTGEPIGTLPSLTINAEAEGASLPVCDPSSGRHYMFVDALAKWNSARVAAEAMHLNGVAGHLATVTSQGENNFLLSRFAAKGWIAGTDETTEGTWIWASGPEAGEVFWQNGITLTYANWDGGEPNNLSGIEHHLMLKGHQAGRWNDNTGAQRGFYAEFETRNLPPLADDLSVSTDEGVPAAITLTGFDPEGVNLAYSIASSPTNGTLGGGVPNLTYTPNAGFSGSDSFTFIASDGCIDSNAGVVTITVKPVNHAPSCSAGGPYSVDDSRLLVLDGTLSFDLDSDALTFSWVTDCSGEFLDDPSSPMVFFQVDESICDAQCETFLTVSDGLASDECSATVHISDGTPPTIQGATAEPSTLWPPRHQMVPVVVTVDTFDQSGVKPVAQIVSVASNEPVEGLGDGDEFPDWEITGPLSVNLRAERSGSGTARLYTITVAANDGCGNAATHDVIVTVPKNGGHR